MTSPLAELIRTKRVIVTVGAGGVGKTTTAAAIATAAAIGGKRVLCLTIDPAKRLAQSLGLEAMTGEPTRIDPARFAAIGVTLKGELTAQMLDTKRTFDELILRYSSTPEKAQQLLNNRLYTYVSTSLAGTQEYMAMERLVAAKSDPQYDLIVLDTPPTANALDFLEAPRRLIEALDSVAMRWFVEAFESTGKLSFNLIAKSASVVLRGIGKITGAGFLQAMAEFITDLNDLFGGFKERATMVQASLRGGDVSFVVVTSPAPVTIREALFFSDRLQEHGMARGAIVVNRFRRAPADGVVAVDSEVVDRAIARHHLELDEGASARIAQAFADAAKLAALDSAQVAQLKGRLRDRVPMVCVEEFATDVRDIKLLTELSAILTTDAPTP